MALRRDDGPERRPERDNNIPRPREQPAARAARPALNEYWVDGDGLSREVLQAEICKYLGAEAFSRPGDYNGHPGYYIKAVRPFTPQMLEDLRTASRDYQREAHKARSRGYEDFSYPDSDTRRNFDNRAFGGQDPYPYPPANYPPGGNQPYTTGPSSYSQPVTSYPTGPGYLPGGLQYPSTQGSIPPIPGQVAGGRPGASYYPYDGVDPNYPQPEYAYSSRPGFDPQAVPRETGIPPMPPYGFNGQSDNSDRRYDDRPSRGGGGGYYDAPTPGPAAGQGFQQPYRGQSTQYDPSAANRETYGRQNPAPDVYGGSRRR